MRERSKTLEDKLAQLTEECAACQRGPDKEVEPHTSPPNHTPQKLVPLFPVCVQQKAEPLGRSNRAPKDLQTQETEVERAKKRDLNVIKDSSGYIVFSL